MRRPAFHCPNITLPRIFKRFKCRSERFPAGVSDNFTPGFQKPPPAVFRYPGRGGEDVSEYSSPVSGENVTFSATPLSPARGDGRHSPDCRRSRDHLHPRRLPISPQPQRCQGWIAIAKPSKRHSSDTENRITIAPQRLNVIARLNLPEIRLSSSARRHRRGALPASVPPPEGSSPAPSRGGAPSRFLYPDRACSVPPTTPPVISLYTPYPL